MKSKTWLLLAALGLLILVLSGCGLAVNLPVVGEFVAASGKVLTEERGVEGITAVSLRGFGSVIIEQGEGESLTVTADENYMPYLKTAMQNGTLILETTDNINFGDPGNIVFRVTVNELNALELAGAGSVNIFGLDTDVLRVTLPGAGSITTSGRVREQVIELIGAGSYNGADLASEEATVRSSGAGSVVVRVSKTLDVVINGVGSVEYIGNPQVTQRILGVGQVNQRN